MKKLHFFKNDPFDIRYKFFKIRMKYLALKLTKVRLKKLLIVIKSIYHIDYPSNDYEYELLKDYVYKYTEIIKNFDDEISNAKQYIHWYKHDHNKEN